MSSQNNSSEISSTAIAAAVGALATTILVVRAVKRSFSPNITSKLACRCDKVRGEICAKAEDSIRLWCYCEDCRNYATRIAELDDSKTTSSPMIYPCGETHIVQVCKSALSIHQGLEHLKLARKTSSSGGTGMFRYYASCCNTPILNTWDFLGFVGVLEDNLDSEREKFQGPYCFCTKEATQTIPVSDKVPEIKVHMFMWNVLRYWPWAKAGPLNYSLKPILWGESKKVE